jgi:hypothetical protein
LSSIVFSRGLRAASFRGEDDVTDDLPRPIYATSEHDMTLVSVSEVQLARGPTLLVATDSMLSAGFRWPRGPKLFTLGAAFAMAFEGDTELAYPLLINARNFISLSDHLSNGDAEPAAAFSRVRLDISEAYEHLVSSKYFDTKGTTCSIILAGWSWRLQGPVVVTLKPPAVGAPLGTQWSLDDVEVRTGNVTRRSLRGTAIEIP